MKRKKKKQKRHTITVNDKTWKILMSRKYPEDTWDELFQREIFPVLHGPELDRALVKMFEKMPQPGAADSK